MKSISFILLWLLILLSACGNTSTENGYDPELYEKAKEIAQSSIILDGHIDVPYRLLDEMEDISQAAEGGDFDYPRAKEGGLDVSFMSIYIPAGKQKTPGASKDHAEHLIAMMDSIIQANPDKFAKTVSPAQAEQNFEQGLMSFAYGMENGSGLEDNLANVKYFYDKGIRYITLTHAKKNRICDSSYDPNKAWGGLSPFGRDVVAEMNRVGIMVDISHVSDSTFYQVLEMTDVPVICSHSSCRHFTPGWERNVSDDMLRALADNGGVIQINYGSAFLTKEANEYSRKKWDYLGNFMDEHDIADSDDPQVEAEEENYKKQNPYPYATVEDVVDHIDHAVQVAGIDHVGLGSDFDGVGDTLPIGLKSPADLPNVVYHLLERGYSEEDIKKILGENVLRVWREVEAHAAGQHSSN